MTFFNAEPAKIAENDNDWALLTPSAENKRLFLQFSAYSAGSVEDAAGALKNVVSQHLRPAVGL